MKKLLFCLAVLIGGPAAAQTVQPWAPPNGYTFQSNTAAAAGRPVQLFPTTTGANWHVAALGEPINFTAPEHFHWDWYSWQSWYATNPWTAATALSYQGGYQQLQDSYLGANAACTTASGAPMEHDTNIEPNPNDHATLPTLDHVAKFMVTGTATLVNFSQPGGVAPCPAKNAGGFGFQVILVNKVSHQMIWYMLQLGHVCGAGAPDYQACLGAQAKPQTLQYWHGADHMTGQTANYAETDIVVPVISTQGAVNSLNIDLMPRLLALLASGNAIDTNRADWQLAGIGHDMSMWGKVDVTVNWQGFVPVITLQ